MFPTQICQILTFCHFTTFLFTFPPLRNKTEIVRCRAIDPAQNVFPDGTDSKESAYNARDSGLSPGLGRSPGEGNGNPLQYSSLENPMVAGFWWASVHGVADSGATEQITQNVHKDIWFYAVGKSQTRLSD